MLKSNEIFLGLLSMVPVYSIFFAFTIFVLQIELIDISHILICIISFDRARETGQNGAATFLTLKKNSSKFEQRTYLQNIDSYMFVVSI